MTDAFTPGLLTRIPEQPHTIALLRASRIGDFFCTTPAFRALRKALPDAEITMVTLPMLKDLVECSPYLDHFAPFPGYPGLAEQLFDPRKAVQFLQQMQEKHFDLAIQMQGSGVYSNPFTLLLGARYTAGFIRPNDPPGRLDAALPMPQDGHEVEHMLALINFLGVPSQGTHIEFPLWPEDHAQAEGILAGTTYPLIGLHPAARDLTRRWSVERFAQAGSRLQEKYGGTLILLGEPEEQHVGEQLEQTLSGRCLNLIGKTSLIVLGAVIARLSLLLTNDTGPAHIAYALGTPTVTIFGGGSPLANGPVQPGPFRVALQPVPCRPCGMGNCPIGYICLERVTVEQVVQSADEVIDSRR